MSTARYIDNLREWGTGMSLSSLVRDRLLIKSMAPYIVDRRDDIDTYYETDARHNGMSVRKAVANIMSQLYRTCTGTCTASSRQTAGRG
jgi:hypothetical protein